MAGQLYGRNRVRSEQARLQKLFDLIVGMEPDSEVGSHYGSYLCIRLSGFAESSIKVLISSHARERSSQTVHRYVEKQVSRVWGINRDKLRSVLDSFDPTWWEELNTQYSQELDSLGSVGKLRDSLSHGGNGVVGLVQVQQYKTDVFRLIEALCEILDPVPSDAS